MSKRTVSFLLAAASRSLLLRDRFSGRMKKNFAPFALEKERIILWSAGRGLSAVYVSAGKDTPVFLICHGIGERVEYWDDVQALLRTMGVSSLVFNYTGFGASRGNVRVGYCEEDAIAAYSELKRRGAETVFLLGFSMGSGVASAVASRVDADGVILCEGFSSLCAAANAAGLPRWLTLLARDIWPTTKHLAMLKVPVLVIHSDEDELFPLSMAEEMARACKSNGEKIVVQGLAHNEPIFAATPTYWRSIVDWSKRQARGLASTERDE